MKDGLRIIMNIVLSGLILFCMLERWRRIVGGIGENLAISYSILVLVTSV